MRIHRLGILLIAALVALVLSGCGGKVPPALIAPSPTAADVQQVRLHAVRIAETVNTALVIVDQAAKLANTTPIPASVKDAIDCSIIKATGLSGPPSPTVTRVCGPIAAGPGVLHKALGVLSDVSSAPSLRTTVVEILSTLDPFLGQLEASGNQALTGFAAILRVSLGFARQFLGGL